LAASARPSPCRRAIVHRPRRSRDLAARVSVIEHLDGLNRYRAGLHIPGNVLVACRNCSTEKRRDDSLRALTLATAGWESFLSHDGSRCARECLTCAYWQRIWEDETKRKANLKRNIERIQVFRRQVRKLKGALRNFSGQLPSLLTNLYSDCQSFAEAEIASLLDKVSDRCQPLSIWNVVCRRDRRLVRELRALNVLRIWGHSLKFFRAHNRAVS